MQVHPAATKGDVVRLLHKIAAWIDRDEDWDHDPSNYEPRPYTGRFERYGGEEEERAAALGLGEA